MRPKRRPKRPYPSQKYGVVHKAMRRRLAPVVATGTVKCARCDELIEPGADWDLDHKDNGPGRLGPSHRSCNRRGGWEKMVGQNGNGSGAPFDAQPYRWSRRWSDDAPVGTIVFLKGGLAEVCIGNKIWRTVEGIRRDGLADSRGRARRGLRRSRDLADRRPLTARIGRYRSGIVGDPYH